MYPSDITYLADIWTKLELVQEKLAELYCLSKIRARFSGDALLRGDIIIS